MKTDAANSRLRPNSHFAMDGRGVTDHLHPSLSTEMSDICDMGYHVVFGMPNIRQPGQLSAGESSAGTILEASHSSKAPRSMRMVRRLR